MRAIPEAHHQRIDREIADWVAHSGGRLTDGPEFEMTQHLFCALSLSDCSIDPEISRRGSH
jgi:hypothetical protein